jgi:formylglycine-generating enzyme required for sulfatase activity
MTPTLAVLWLLATAEFTVPAAGAPAAGAPAAGAPAAGAPADPLAAAPAALPCAPAAPAGMACVPGGPFVRGSDDGPKDARPAGRVWVQTFHMDLYEVTYAEYQACVKAGGCPKREPNYDDYSRPRQPMVGVTWFDAVAYCRAQGKHLPTEAEWEKAARGPDGATYPWGEEPATCERAVIKDRRGRGCGTPKKGRHPEKGRTLEVGTRPPGVYGLFDMAGNSWEWVADWYTKSWADCGADCEGVDPRGPCGGSAEPCRGHAYKVVRGGSWYWPGTYAKGYHRRPHWPENEWPRYHHFGFRCAASVSEAGALAARPAGPGPDRP